jgi:predicted TIM-barrel fold metal-dependent hydrolase
MLLAPAVVDADHHVWDLTVRPQSFLDTASAFAPLRRSFLLQELVPQATAVGVTATVVNSLADAGGGAPYEETPAPSPSAAR